MAQNTRNIARRFAAINKASNGLLLDLIERYEQAAIVEDELATIEEKIMNGEKELDRAKSRTGDSKAERAIENRLVALDAKQLSVQARVDRAEESVRVGLERLANQISSTVLNLMNA